MNYRIPENRNGRTPLFEAARVTEQVAHLVQSRSFDEQLSPVHDAEALEGRIIVRKGRAHVVQRASDERVSF